VALNRNPDVKWRVGVKYCGGCNPEYDRVALVKQLQMDLKDKVAFVSPESEGVHFILAVQGCSTACADLSPYGELEIRIITSIHDGEKFVKEMD